MAPRNDGGIGISVMSLIGRLIVIFIGFLAACFVGGMIVVVALLFPEFADLGAGPVDQGAIDILLGFGFFFVSGLALVPAAVSCRSGAASRRIRNRRQSSTSLRRWLQEPTSG